MCMAAHLARSRFRSDQHAQVSRLATWLRKHQDEALPGGVQAQLLDCIQLYYKAAIAHPEIKVSHQLSIRRPRVHSAFKACIPSTGTAESHSREQQDAVYKLIDDLLKLPEGKLVSSKSKASSVPVTTMCLRENVVRVRVRMCDRV